MSLGESLRNDQKLSKNNCDLKKWFEDLVRSYIRRQKSWMLLLDATWWCRTDSKVPDSCWLTAWDSTKRLLITIATPTSLGSVYILSVPLFGCPKEVLIRGREANSKTAKGCLSLYRKSTLTLQTEQFRISMKWPRIVRRTAGRPGEQAGLSNLPAWCACAKI